MKTSCRAAIIDDESWIREGLSEHINWERIGIELVGSFEDGREALQIIKNNPIDIIMTDIRMPNMTGLEFLAELRKIEKHNPDAPTSKVVIMSGFDDFKYAQEAIRLGASDYLLKPTAVEDTEKVLLKLKARCQDERNARLRIPNLPAPAEGIDENASFLIKKAIKLMNERFTEDLHLVQIAEELYITPNYLSRIFKQETGKSFSDYLSSKRIEKSCELLTKSTLKIYQIGEAIGYPNPRYFSEWFQKQTGMSPGDYRKYHS
ncbi:response regulator [Cohnella sp. REN36]|uniref:response regulator transcription factor n=1 Tax=Cohnella sp. REN36 TaxID=2887347 RepID=UPI001D15BAB2|nr:response regulator [Cohnella sp. REN36]MCC3372260.1 response regulator [Cohnella sp. REN36]